ncbi:protein of unknown function [Ralstonia solanacearum PSI07]|nr:protein of unknown function [Ralstonia solanacearum PSI07]
MSGVLRECAIIRHRHAGAPADARTLVGNTSSSNEVAGWHPAENEPEPRTV